MTRESNSVLRRYSGIKLRTIRGMYKFYGSQKKIICQHHDMANDLILINPALEGKVITINNPIYPIPSKKLIAKAKSNTLKLLFVGRLAKVKNIDFLLDLVCALNTHSVDISLDIVGEGREECSLKTSVMEKGIQNLVSFLGNQEVKDIYREYDVLLLSSWTEGFPNVVIEAMAYGIRCILTSPCCEALKKFDHIDILQLEVNSWVEILTDIAANKPDYSESYLEQVKEYHSIQNLDVLFDDEN